MAFVIDKLKSFFAANSASLIARKRSTRVLGCVKTGANPGLVWENIEHIGDGSFGLIFKARNKESGALAVLKQVDILNPDDLDEHTVEIDILSQMRHQNIVALYEAYHFDDKLWIYLEYCAGGALDRIMYELERPLTELQIRYVCIQMCQGLEYLHMNGVIHRDLKAGNVLLTTGGQVKLADFGVSAKCQLDEKRNSFVGTPYWMAPEVISCETNKDEPYDYKADIWSLGITLIELAQMHPPNHKMNPGRVTMRIHLADAPTLDLPHKWSSDFNDFLSKCLQKNPIDRLSAQQLLQQAFLLSIDEKVGEKTIAQLISEANADVTVDVEDIDIESEDSPVERSDDAAPSSSDGDSQSADLIITSFSTAPVKKTAVTAAGPATTAATSPSVTTSAAVAPAGLAPLASPVEKRVAPPPPQPEVQTKPISSTISPPKTETSQQPVKLSPVIAIQSQSPNTNKSELPTSQSQVLLITSPTSVNTLKISTTLSPSLSSTSVSAQNKSQFSTKPSSPLPNKSQAVPNLSQSAPNKSQASSSLIAATVVSPATTETSKPPLVSPVVMTPTTAATKAPLATKITTTATTRVSLLQPSITTTTKAQPLTTTVTAPTANTIIGKSITSPSISIVAADVSTRPLMNGSSIKPTPAQDLVSSNNANTSSSSSHYSSSNDPQRYTSATPLAAPKTSPQPHMRTPEITNGGIQSYKPGLLRANISGVTPSSQTPRELAVRAYTDPNTKMAATSGMFVDISRMSQEPIRIPRPSRRTAETEEQTKSVMITDRGQVEEVTKRRVAETEEQTKRRTAETEEQTKSVLISDYDSDDDKIEGRRKQNGRSLTPPRDYVLTDDEDLDGHTSVAPITTRHDTSPVIFTGLASKRLLQGPPPPHDENHNGTNGNSESFNRHKSRYRSFTKTRKYEYDGKVITSQTSKIILSGDEDRPREELESRNANLRALKLLQMAENRKKAELDQKFHAQLVQLDKQMELNMLELIKKNTADTDHLAHDQKLDIERLEAAHAQMIRTTIKNIKTQQDKDLKSFQESLRRELRAVKHESNTMPRDLRKDMQRRRTEQKQAEQEEMERTFMAQQRDAMDKTMRRLMQQHREEMFIKEKQLLAEKQQLQRVCEASMWSADENFVAEVTTLKKRHIQQLYELLKQQTTYRHTQELEMTRRLNERNESDLLRRQTADRKQTIKQLKAESRSRIAQFRDRLRNQQGPHSSESEREQLREFEEKENSQLIEETERYDARLKAQLDDLKTKNVQSITELNQMHADRQALLTAQEKEKLKEQIDLYNSRMAEWKRELANRKQVLENEFARQISEQQKFYASPGNAAFYQPHVTMHQSATLDHFPTPLPSRRAGGGWGGGGRGGGGRFDWGGGGLGGNPRRQDRQVPATWTGDTHMSTAF